jgi:deoxyribodipyrimidine photolyase
VPPPPARAPQVAEAVGASRVFYSRRYEPAAAAADDAVAAALAAAGYEVGAAAGSIAGPHRLASSGGPLPAPRPLPPPPPARHGPAVPARPRPPPRRPPAQVRSFAGHLLREPQAVTLDLSKWGGGHFGTFTPFYKAWERAGRLGEPLKAPKRLPAAEESPAAR